MFTSSTNRLNLTIFFLTALLGGGTSVAVRFSNQELAPFWNASLRFAASGLLFWLILLFRRIRLPSPRDVLILALTGFFSVGVSFALLYLAFVDLPASLGSVIIAMGPLITFLLAILHGMEQFRWQSLLGGLLALTGIAIAVQAQVSATVPLRAVLTLMLGSTIAAEGNLIMKRLSPNSDPAATNAITLSAGLVLLLLLSFFFGEAHPLPSRAVTWIAVLYAIIPGTLLTFYMFVWLLGRWSASSTHYAVMLFPIVATTAGNLLAGEHITPQFLAGGVMVIAGVYAGALLKR